MTKELVKRALVGSGILRLGSILAGRGAALIMYHSVLDDPGSVETTLGGIAHSAAVFRGQMEVLARHFNVVNMDQVLSFVKGEAELPNRSVVVTFDDGYADNYHVASPILSNVGIPAIFYVTVGCIDQSTLPWPARLRFAFLTSAKHEWTSPGGRVWPIHSSEARVKAFDHASEYIARLSGAAQNELLATIYGDLETEVANTLDGLMMTWDEVRGLTSNGHTIGSHTVTHPNMAWVKEEDARAEFLESKQRLEIELERPVIHFSYPCPVLQPHWKDKTVELSREAGYKTAVTTNGGMVRRNDEPLCLRRIRPTKTIEGLRWNLECTFAGRPR
jgi:peptidoglycan/xylan/chitin deacetylase (PgdA/CDA1 family)